MTTRTIQKALAGLQDLLLGAGTVSQNRAGTVLDITRINASDLIVYGDYDFVVNSGDIGSYTLLGPDNSEISLPDNATVVKAWYEVLTAPTSLGPATIALGIEDDDAAGIVAVIAYNNAAFALGYHDAIPDGTTANFTNKTTAIKDVILTIAGANLTAGKIRVWLEYVSSE